MEDSKGHCTSLKPVLWVNRIPFCFSLWRDSIIPTIFLPMGWWELWSKAFGRPVDWRRWRSQMLLALRQSQLIKPYFLYQRINRLPCWDGLSLITHQQFLPFSNDQPFLFQNSVKLYLPPFLLFLASFTRLLMIKWDFKIKIKQRTCVQNYWWIITWERKVSE